MNRSLREALRHTQMRARLQEIVTALGLWEDATDKFEPQGADYHSTESFTERTYQGQPDELHIGFRAY